MLLLLLLCASTGVATAAGSNGWHAPDDVKSDGTLYNKKFDPSKAAAAIPQPGTTGSPKLFTYRVVQAHHHDQGAFTQALECSKEKPGCETFYESTGLYGKTSVREVDRVTGKVVRQQANIAKKWFGEGMVRWNDEFWLLNWKTTTGQVFDATTLDVKREFTTPMRNDGWGLTINTDNGEWIGTDSSEVMYFMKPSADGSKLEELRHVSRHSTTQHRLFCMVPADADFMF